MFFFNSTRFQILIYENLLVLLQNSIYKKSFPWRNRFRYLLAFCYLVVCPHSSTAVLPHIDCCSCATEKLINISCFCPRVLRPPIMFQHDCGCKWLEHGIMTFFGRAAATTWTLQNPPEAREPRNFPMLFSSLYQSFVYVVSSDQNLNILRSSWYTIAKFHTSALPACDNWRRNRRYAQVQMFCLILL